MERRGNYIDELEAEIGPLHPSLVQLVKQCLHNAPHRRPTTDEVLDSLKGMRMKIECSYGGSLVKLDIDKILLTKELKMKNKRLEEMEVRLKHALQVTEETTEQLEVSIHNFRDHLYYTFCFRLVNNSYK